MKGAAVLSAAFLPVFKFSGMRLFCTASSYRRFQRHNHTAGRASPLAICSELYSRCELSVISVPFNYSRKIFITKTPPLHRNPVTAVGSSYMRPDTTQRNGAFCGLSLEMQSDATEFQRLKRRHCGCRTADALHSCIFV
jgi:hypothetical protein